MQNAECRMQNAEWKQRGKDSARSCRYSTRVTRSLVDCQEVNADGAEKPRGRRAAILMGDWREPSTAVCDTMRKLRNDGKPIRIDARLRALPDVLRPVEGLAAVYLFGSYGTAYQTPLSDVDLALVFREGAVPAVNEETALRGSILDALGEEDVSITVLNRAPALFQFRVLATGRLLYRADARALADFIARLLTRHADFQIDYDHFVREYDWALRARYAHA